MDFTFAVDVVDEHSYMRHIKCCVYVSIYRHDKNAKMAGYKQYRQPT
jgi:hypothetical protein